MVTKQGVRSPPEPVRNRCRCGHYPTAHLEVRPVPGGGSASFALLPTGPCQVCGASECPSYATGR
ncbi:MAG: hypothetical protein L3K13_06440 [Thermoplasmata archaeon]|nr:hypothetical protein [Thermoplasmata archaeon]